MIAIARDAAGLAELPALGATSTAVLGSEDLTASADVDVVLDYLWGEPAASVMAALVTARADRSAPLTWIQIGSVAGAAAPIPSAALRASRLQIVGSGQGSISTRDILAELVELAAFLGAGGLPIEPRAVRLAELEAAWSAPAGSADRLVVVP